MTNIEVYGLRKSAVCNVHCDVGSYHAELQTQAAVTLTSLRDVVKILDARNASSSVQPVERRSHENCVQNIQ